MSGGVQLPPLRSGKRWTNKELRTLAGMWRKGVHIKVISYEMGRSEAAIYMALHKKYEPDPKETPNP